MGQVKGYKQTRIASTSANIYTGAGIKLDDGNYAFGYWSIRNMRARYIRSRNKIKFEFEARPSTNPMYDEVGSVAMATGADVVDTHLYIHDILILSADKTTTYLNMNFGDIHSLGGAKKAFEIGWLGTDDDSYDPNYYIPRFNISTQRYRFQPGNFWIDLDRVQIESTGGQKNNVLASIDHTEGLVVRCFLYQNPGAVEAVDDEEGDTDVSDWLEFEKSFDPLKLEKPKDDYSPRYFNRTYSTAGSGYGIASDYILFSQPKGIKKLQRGNFNIWLGTSPVSAITPDGATTEHTQISYANTNWDLEVSLDNGVTFSAFESEAAYTFGTAATQPFTDTNSIWFHDEVLIGDFDDTTIGNMNNCYFSDMLFKYAPTEFAHDSTVTADYYYRIMDNFEDKTDSGIT